MTNRKVLVLNADHQPLTLVPLSVIPWTDAFTIITKGHAVPIKFYEGEYIKTPSTEFKLPSVIVLSEYKHFKKQAKWSKSNVKIRDEYLCGYCGKRFSERSLTIDHIVPKSLGGKHSWLNSITACKTCNAKKGAKKGIKPLFKAYKPTHYALAKKLYKLKRIENSEWSMYTAHLV